MPDADGASRLPHAFAAAWNRRDPDALADLFEADAEFVNVVGLWWHDREAIRRAHAYGLEHIFPDSTLRVVRTKAKALGPGLAVVHAVMVLTGQSAGGGVERPGERRTVFSFVARRGPSGWRCASAHNTDVVAGAETHVRGADGALRAADYRTSGDSLSAGASDRGAVAAVRTSLSSPTPMSPSDFVTRHAAALVDGDLDAITDLYSEDAVLLSFEWTANGRDAIRDRFSRFLEFHGEISDVTVAHQQTTGDSAFVQYAITGERGTFQLVNVFVLDGEQCARHYSNEIAVDLDRDEVEKDA